MLTMEGLIEVDIGEFYNYLVKTHAPQLNGMLVDFGPTKINIDNRCLEIPFAAGSDTHPSDWASNPMKAKWDEIKEK